MKKAFEQLLLNTSTEFSEVRFRMVQSMMISFSCLGVTQNVIVQVNVVYCNIFRDLGICW